MKERIVGRTPKKYVDYFPHLCKHGESMHYMEKKYQNDGYAVWYKLLEKLALTDDHYLDLKKESKIMYLSSFCLVSEEMLLNIIDDLVKLEEFHIELWEKHKIIYNEKFIDNVQDAYRMRNSKLRSLSDLCCSLSIKLRSIPNKLQNNAQEIHILNKIKLNKTKKRYMEAVNLTDIEYQKLLKDHYLNDEVLLNKAIKILNNYIMIKEPKYKSHYHVMFGWVKERIFEENKDRKKELDPDNEFRTIEGLFERFGIENEPTLSERTNKIIRLMGGWINCCNREPKENKKKFMQALEDL
jgi:hypothetical protein